MTTNQQPVEVGEYIEIPAWRVAGLVTSVKPADLGSDDAIEVTLQEVPEGQERRYRLEPDEYRIVG